MKEKYNIVISERQAVPRSKRMRESGQSISSAAVLVSGSSGGNSSCDGHTHTNLPALERIGFDENDDKYLTVRVGSVDDGTGELIITHERAKAGYADKAHDLDDDSPVNERFLRKDIDDETAFLLKLLGGLIVDNGLDVTKGISTDTLTATTATTQILNVLDKLIAKSATFSDNVTVSKKTTTLNLLVQELAEIHDLSVSHVATLMGTIVKDYISSESFVSGFGGEGMKIYKAVTGDWNMEIDNLTVRKIFSVFELVVQKITYQGGMIIRSAAGGKLTKVIDGGSYWRCEHDSTDDFVQDDQIICQAFTGTATKRYWRLVTSAGAGYFNLSKVDCEEGSGMPETGDNVSVLGNRTNTARQKAQIDCAVGDSAPYRDDYDGINSYSLVNRLITRTGNLNGITDAVFGILTGSGLYGTNVYLKGTFVLHSGKKIEEAIDDVKNDLNGRITDVETNFEIREGQISSKIKEVNIAVSNAKQSETNASGSATSAGVSANNASKSATDAQGAATNAGKILEEVTLKESSVTQTAGEISTKVTEVNKKVTEANTAATNAKNSATSASGSAGTASGKAGEAANSAANAKQSADNAAKVLEDVTLKESSITQTAGNITLQVTEVTKKVVEANTAATTASTKAAEASTSAGTASTKAGEASTSATNAKNSASTASTKAGEASTSATNAKNSATSASGSAGTASGKAGEAANSAANAKQSADNAAKVLEDVTLKESSITQTAGNITLQVTEVTKKVVEANTAATTASTKAAEASTSAGTASTKAGEASTSATNAKNSASTASTKAGEASTSATNAKNSADSAAAKLTTISQKESSINQTASSITLQVKEVTTKANEAANSATTAATKAGEAASSATNAAKSATDAKALLDNVDGKYVTKTVYDSGIKVLSDSINLKVEKTDFNALGSRVSAAETSISTQAGQIALKASQSSVNDLTGRMSTAESCITQNAEQISLKVTSTEAGNIADGKVNALKGDLQATGIDIANRKVTVTADTFRVQDNYGNAIAVFKTNTAGKPILRAENIDVDNLVVKKLAAVDGTIGGFKISANSIGTGSTSIPTIDKKEMFLYDDMIGFNSQNRQVIVGPFNTMGVDYLGRFYDHRSRPYDTNNGVVIDVSGGRDNIALSLNGGLIANGKRGIDEYIEIAQVWHNGSTRTKVLQFKNGILFSATW